MISKIASTIKGNVLEIEYCAPKVFKMSIYRGDVENGDRYSIQIDREVIEWLKDSYNILYTTMLIEEKPEDKT